MPSAATRCAGIAIAFAAISLGLLLATGAAAFDAAPARLEPVDHDTALAALGALPPGDQYLVLEATQHPELLAAIGALLEATRREVDALPAGPRAALERAAVDALSLQEALEDAPLSALAARSEQRFEALLAGCSAGTQQIFRTLLRQPGLLTLLASHPAVVAELGGLFADDPAAAERRLALAAGVGPGGPAEGDVPTGLRHVHPSERPGAQMAAFNSAMQGGSGPRPAWWGNATSSGRGVVTFRTRSSWGRTAVAPPRWQAPLIPPHAIRHHRGPGMYRVERLHRSFEQRRLHRLRRGYGRR